MHAQGQVSPATAAFDASATSSEGTAWNHASYEGMARRHLGPLYARALQLTGNHHDALDLVQDTFETALRKLPAELPESRVGFWLAAILRNRFIDICRSSENRGRSKAVDPAEVAIANPEPTDEPRWASADAARLAPLVRRLKPVFREVLHLRVQRRLSYAEIAVRLRVPISTVGTRYHRAVGCLRQALAVEVS